MEKNQKRFERISKISQASKFGARGLDIDTTIDTAAQASQMIDGVNINNQTIQNSVMTGENANIEDKGPGTNSNDPIPKTDQAATSTIDNSYQQAAIQQIKQQLSFTYTQNPKNQTFAFKNQQIANTPYHLVKAYPQQYVIK